MSEIAAIVLAAGRATRFGSGPETSKVLALLEGKPLVRHVVEAALASRCGEIVVVTGHAKDAVDSALSAIPARRVHNPDFASGMASSLEAGIAALSPTAAGAIVLLADMPLVTPAIIDLLVARFQDGGLTADAIVPVHEGRRGNPVLLSRALFSAIAGLEGDQGARTLLATRNVLECAVPDAAIMFDIDTPEALRSLREAEARESSRDPAAR